MPDINKLKTETGTKSLLHDSSIEMRISGPVLEDVCKKMIEVILHCLPQAIRGTIYKVGPIPQLRVIRVASGRRHGETDDIQWDGRTESDYASPGKVWQDYCDFPGRVLEAMAWCVERQLSWTTDNPEDNVRSERKLLEGKAEEDYHHMEPVLVEKTDLWEMMPPPDAYPKDYEGDPIWQRSPYATVAVIKIHFLPGCVKRYDRSTKVIKELSQSLGTQMLSLHAREITLEKERHLAQERQDACNILAHEFRNVTPKIGFAYRAINNEISYLRESWENIIHEQFPEQLNKKIILENLEGILNVVKEKFTPVESSQEGSASESGPQLNSPDKFEIQGGKISTPTESSGLGGQAIRRELSHDISILSRYQNQLMTSCFLPSKNAMWLKAKIRPLWDSILAKTDLNPTMNRKVEGLLQNLRESFRVGQDRELRNKVKIVPVDLKSRWVNLAYRELNGNTNGIIQEYIDLLKDIDLDLPRKNHSLKNFTYLKALVELIPEIEKKVNRRLETLKNSK